MTDSLFRRIVVPIASVEDARTTTQALVPYIEVASEVIAINVIEKAGGAPDKASVEQRELYAEEIFDAVIQEFAKTDVTVETEIRYGTNVAEAIITAAHDSDASAIAFTPRDVSRWTRMLTGDVALNLVTESDVPVVSLPDKSDTDADAPYE